MILPMLNPSPISQTELAEIELRARRLIRTDGKEDRRSTFQYGKEARVFETTSIRILSATDYMEIRYAGAPVGWIALYELAWRRMHNNLVEHTALVVPALKVMRQLMILDDLADV
jgi:hypothetical protein